MRTDLSHVRKSKTAGFTLAEVVMSMAITATVFGGIILAYVQSARRAEWTGYSLAAQGLAIQQIEQVRSARWDLTTGVNETLSLNLLSSNYSGGVLKGYTWANLDIPYSGTNFVRATNYVTITVISNWNNVSVPPVPLRMVRVDTVWPFSTRKGVDYFTNTLCTYCAPDN